VDVDMFEGEVLESVLVVRQALGCVLAVKKEFGCMLAAKHGL